MSFKTVTIDAPEAAQDGVLLDRVAAWAAAEPISFLRVNKPSWGLEVVRYGAERLDADSADAVADSALALHLLALDRRGLLPRSRREILLRAMRRIADGLGLSREDRLALHHDGYAWAIELGRWDGAGMAALATRFSELRGGIEALLAMPCDPESEARWSRLTPDPGPRPALSRAATAMRHHANRMGLFAETEAILHYFLFRLDSPADEA